MKTAPETSFGMEFSSKDGYEDGLQADAGGQNTTFCQYFPYRDFGFHPPSSACRGAAGLGLAVDSRRKVRENAGEHSYVGLAVIKDSQYGKHCGLR